MADLKDYIENNRKLWNDLVDIHLASPLYDLPGFRAGKTALDPIVLAEVGDVSGKRILHLLCRFGLDSLSWARRGAAVTGVDLSDKAVTEAKALSADCDLPARFVCCEVFEAPEHIDQAFDIVFMSWGALCWISDFPRLAKLVSGFLRPGGFYYVMDAHPVFTALDGKWRPEEGPLRLIEDYQTGIKPLGYGWGPDYADPSRRPDHNQAYEWAHGLGRVVTYLVEAGLTIEFLHEHDVVGWKGLDGLEQKEDGFWGLPAGVVQLPLSYSVKATKI